MTARKARGPHAKRGPRGDGSVYPRGKRYTASVSLGYKVGPDGERRRHRKTVSGATKEEAARAKRELQHRLDTGQSVASGTSTVSEFLRFWLAGRRTDLTHRSQERYSTIIERHLVPEIGQVKLRELTPLHMQQLVTSLRLKGLSANYVRMIFGLAHGALDRALALELMSRDVCKPVKLPPEEEFTPRPLSPKEASQLLVAVMDDRLAALWLLLIGTGIRIGEALGLRWKDVDLARHCLAVNLTLKMRKAGTDLDGEKGPVVILTPTLYLGKPKTKSSKVRLALPGVVTADLIAHRDRQAFERQAAGAGWHDHDLVFCQPTGKPLDPSKMLRKLKLLLAAEGLPVVRQHDLRHTCANLMILRGGDLKRVQKQMRHAKIGTTMDQYGHVGPELQESAAAEMNDFLKAVPGRIRGT